jgi:hypothetical protein
MVGTGGTLMAIAVSSLLRSQRRVVESGNQYAMVNDFLNCLSRDVRRSTGAVLSDGDEANLKQTLVLSDSRQRVSYRFHKQTVERWASDPPGVMTKSWGPLEADVRVLRSPKGNHDVAVDVTVRWHRTDAKDPGPARRFDLVTRCAGEMDYEED